MLQISINDPKTAGKAIKALAKFTSKEKHRSSLQVIDFVYLDDHLHLTAVDGYRLAEIQLPIEYTGDLTRFALSAQHLSKLSDIQQIVITDGQSRTAVITSGGADISIPMAEPHGHRWAKFVDTIPTETENGLTINPKYIADACALMQAVSTSRTTGASLYGMGSHISPLLVMSERTEIKARALVLPIRV